MGFGFRQTETNQDGSRRTDSRIFSAHRGATSINITNHGINTAYGIKKLRDILGIALQEMIYIGDALFVGGNDYPAEQTGVISIPIRNPDETKRVIEAIIACLGPEEQSRSFEVDQ